MDLLFHLHPKLVHFPIALFVTAWVFDFISLIIKKESVHKAAVYVYGMAALSSTITVLSGLWEANRLHLHHPIFYAHRNIAWVLLVQSWLFFIIYLILRRFYPSRAHLFFTVMCLISAALVIAVGFYGGQLVYDYGVGISS